MRIERFSDWDALGIGESGWNRLVERCRAPAPFATWQFQTAWFRAFVSGPLHLLAAQDGAGEWVGVLPLYETPTPDGPVLRLVGGTDVADYLDLIAVAGREEEVWKAMLPALADLAWRTVDLRPVPAVSATPGLLAGLAASAGLTSRVDVEDRCPVIELPATWDGYLAGLTGKDRHELRRKMRRAEAGQPAGRGGADPGGHGRADGRLRRAPPAIQGRQGALHGRAHGGLLSRDSGRAGRARDWRPSGCSGSRSARRPRSSASSRAGAVSLYNSGFDPEARAMSPGVVLIARTIEDAIARGFRRYDFLPWRGAVQVRLRRRADGRPARDAGAAMTPASPRAAVARSRARRALRAHLPPRRARRQGDGRDERLRARGVARARAAWASRSTCSRGARIRGSRRSVRLGTGRAGDPRPRRAGPADGAGRGGRPSRGVRGRRRDVPRARARALRSRPQPLLAVGAGGAGPGASLGRAARPHVPHARSDQERGRRRIGRHRARRAAGRRESGSPRPPTGSWRRTWSSARISPGTWAPIRAGWR